MENRIIIITVAAAIGVVLITLAFVLGYKQLIMEKKCTRKTVGTVRRYSLFEHPLPVVHYTVDGVEYKVTGPRYRAYITVSKTGLLNKNETSAVWEDKKQRLHIRYVFNSAVSIARNPLAQLYPIGSQQDVFYCPDKPKLAYVKRYCNRKYLFWLPFSLGIFFPAAMIALAFVLF